VGGQHHAPASLPQQEPVSGRCFYQYKAKGTRCAIFRSHGRNSFNVRKPEYGKSLIHNVVVIVVVVAAADVDDEV
jgi:hypothetical protein